MPDEDKISLFPRECRPRSQGLDSGAAASDLETPRHLFSLAPRLFHIASYAKCKTRRDRPENRIYTSVSLGFEFVTPLIESFDIPCKRVSQSFQSDYFLLAAFWPIVFSRVSTLNTPSTVPRFLRSHDLTPSCNGLRCAEFVRDRVFVCRLGLKVG